MEGYHVDNHCGDQSDDSSLSDLSSPRDLPDDFQYFTTSLEYDSIEAVSEEVIDPRVQLGRLTRSSKAAAETAARKSSETLLSRIYVKNRPEKTVGKFRHGPVEEEHNDMEASIEDSIESSIESSIEVYAGEQPTDDDEPKEFTAEAEEPPAKELPDQLIGGPTDTCAGEVKKQHIDRSIGKGSEKVRPHGRVLPTPDPCQQDFPSLLRLPPLRESVHRSLASSVSALTDLSELSPVPSLASSSSKATTPIDTDTSPNATGPTPLLPATQARTKTPPQQAPASPSLSLLPDLQPPRPAIVPLPYTIQSIFSSLHSPPSPMTAAPRAPRSSPLPVRVVHKVRPKSSIPADLSAREYARQCVAAAESSRLNPYALDEEERMLLRQHISHAQVTTYLNIRNGILRLWARRPGVAVIRQEALGCAKDSRWFDAANVCFHWLVRRGYINFGCVQIRAVQSSVSGGGGTPLRKRNKRIVVIGAGLAGLGCARQLDGLFKQYASRFSEVEGEGPPEVIILEGRSRIGGRVYSRPFKQQLQDQGMHEKVGGEGDKDGKGDGDADGKETAGRFAGFRCTAEMGGMIITGFDRGNPLNVIVRGQLGLPYHALWSETTIYDTDGKPVDRRRDDMVENLFNECLDRVSEYKFKTPAQVPVEGNRDLMDEGRDSSGSAEGHRTIACVEDSQAAVQAENTAQLVQTAQTAHLAIQATAMSTIAATVTGAAIPPQILPVMRMQTSMTVATADDQSVGGTPGTSGAPGTPGTLPAAFKVQKIGWELKPGVAESRDLDLDAAANTPGATLGSVVDEAIKQYQDMVDLNAQDFRLLNWHIANLEYSNAINHARLSLQGWDIDAGNEWEGKHSMVIGGYQAVPRGLMRCPTLLDVRRNTVVTRITYSLDAGSSSTASDDGGGTGAPVTIECEGGQIFEADYVVNTIPLGVLKHGSVRFEPPLPGWKADAIRRLGYGVLNKVILTFRKIFWDPKHDIFGVLREPNSGLSLNQQDYSRRRGHMFQWFNVTTTTGLPCLLALMAGDAAYDTETSSNDELVAEATAVLRSVFGADNVPSPAEAVVTRWASDPFARGSYSSAGPEMRMDDYDVMARPVGRHLLFAGEHTAGTHPATVHGAYLSGLRAASELIEELLGPIDVPEPLIMPREMAASLKRKAAREEDESAGGVATGDESGSGSSSAASKNNSTNLGSSHRAVKASLRRRLEEREQQVQQYVRAQIGERPLQPARVVDTSYLLFSKANYERARKKCEEAMMSRRKAAGGPGSSSTGSANANASARAQPNDVRVLTSKMWRSASAEERQPYAERAAAEKKAYLAALEQHKRKAEQWDQQAAVLRAAFAKSEAEKTTGAAGTAGAAGVADTTTETTGTTGTTTTASTAVTAMTMTATASTVTAATNSSTEQAGRSPSARRRLRRVTNHAADVDSSDVDMTG